MKTEGSRQKWPLRWVCIALILCLIGAAGANLVQTNGGQIQVREVKWVDYNGDMISAYLLIPPNATKDTPAPGIVCIEGWYNNKAMQDLYYVELARRGYVVMSMDMLSHGDSDSVDLTRLYDNAVGIDGAVRYMDSLDFVENGSIGLTGHSGGGFDANMSIGIDNERPQQKIKAFLLQAALMIDDLGIEYNDKYGSRSVAIIADLYDDFLVDFRHDYLASDEARQFLNFNDDPSSFAAAGQAGQLYTRDYNGTIAYRAVYSPATIHPGVHFSTECVGYAIDFFEAAMPAPNPLPASNQVWPFKTAFNSLGLLGFFMFLVAFTLAMLRTSYFSALATDGILTARRTLDTRKAKIWFWWPLIATAVFSFAIFIPILDKFYFMANAVFQQDGPLCIGVWAACTGAFAFVMLLINYYAYGKKNGFSLRDTGVYIGGSKLIKTILLALIAVSVTYSLVFISHYFFLTDFRIWVIGIKTFGPDKLLVALPFLLLFLVYFVVNSITINSFNFIKIGNKDWVNTVILVLMNVAASIAIIVVFYVTFAVNGDPIWDNSYGQQISAIWQFPVLLYLSFGAVASRMIYRRTNNPYLAGIIMAIIVTIISCTNTFTVVGGVADVVIDSMY